MYIVAFFLLAATADCEAIYQAVTDAKAFPAPEKKIQHLLYRGRKESMNRGWRTSMFRRVSSMPPSGF
jgi:hypothetical protein